MLFIKYLGSRLVEEHLIQKIEVHDKTMILFKVNSCFMYHKNFMISNQLCLKEMIIELLALSVLGHARSNILVASDELGNRSFHNSKQLAGF